MPVLKEVELPSANFVSNAVAVHDCHRQPMYDGISKVTHAPEISVAQRVQDID